MQATEENQTWGVRCAGRRGTIFLISLEDVGWVRVHRWYALAAGAGTAVVRYESKPEGGVRAVRLAADLSSRIWGGQNGKIVAHINGNVLDFRRANLHLAPRSAAPAPGRGVCQRDRGGRTVYAATATVRTEAGSKRVTRVFDTAAEAEDWRAAQRVLGDPVSLALQPPPPAEMRGIIDCAPPPISSAWSVQFE